MVTRTDHRMLRMGLLALMATAASAGGASAEIKSPCVDNGGKFPAACTKEIRIWNNTSGTIYPLLQASRQDTEAMNCPASKGGGDIWLQRALNDTSKCYPVTKDYYAYVNPTSGIPPGGFASVSLPWWSKRAPGGPDVYIDWWRAGRLFLFDDQVALNDSYALLKNRPQVAFAKGSPMVACNSAIPKIGTVQNACKQLQVFQVTDAAAIGTQTPYQLNEFTFASVDSVGKGGALQNLNQNYNVSNVDQVYLPVAIGPVRQPADVGYMGTTMSVAQFRKQLAAFTGVDKAPNNPVWPIYNNPQVKNKPMYPTAGIRVPSTQTVLNFYMNPFYFAGGGSIPQIIPAKPPKLISGLMDQWANCTADKPRGCPASDVYKEINQTFLDSYKKYIATCNTVPKFLKPVGGNPPRPSPTAFLTYVYGWVPFNFSCPNAPLPTTDEPPAGSRVPIDYMHIQYNYEELPKAPAQWFNPYTQLIHAPVKAGGLAANAYAFSIDDHSSFLSNSGGSTPGGLVFAIGGDNGLPNKAQVPPPTPPFYKYFDFVVAIGPPAKNGPTWAKYGICSNTADTLFPGSGDGAYALGIDPSLVRMPCTVTFLDSDNKKYQLKILKAAVPPKQIWPTFKAANGVNFDPAVLSCPSGDGLVAPKNWCSFTNELADPTQKPGIYSISTRGPFVSPKE